LVHFKFTGWLIPSWVENPAPRRFLHPMDPGKHTRMEINTDRGTVFLTDPRCLSRTWIYPSLKAALTGNELKAMAPDVDTEAGIRSLLVGISRTGRRIRDVIMDQRLAAGIGNYLCCEALYRAGLHGAEKAKTLTDDQKVRLIESIREVVKLGESEDNHDWWAVFRKKKCPKDHSVTRESWGSRGHYCCYTCQPPSVRV
jgi:formamidopyrimidine-DNA glycosylase